MGRAVRRFAPLGRACSWKFVTVSADREEKEGIEESGWQMERERQRNGERKRRRESGMRTARERGKEEWRERARESKSGEGDRRSVRMCPGEFGESWCLSSTAAKASDAWADRLLLLSNKEIRFWPRGRR